MSRRHFFWDREARDGLGDWVEYRPTIRKRLTPYVISDHLDGVRNPVDGRQYDSKSAYYKAVRAAGCEIAGNDSRITEPQQREYVPQGIGQDLKRAFEQAGS